MSTNKTPAFLLLPLELHDLIGSKLAIFSLKSLIRTCRHLNKAYTRAYFARAGAWLHRELYVGRHGRDMNDYSDLNFGFGPHLQLEDEESPSTESSYYCRSDMPQNLMRAAKADVIKEILVIDGGWNDIDIVGPLVGETIYLCTSSIDKGGSDALVKMDLYTDRLVELGIGPYRRSLMERALSLPRYACIKLLGTKGICPGQEAVEEWAEMIFENLRAFALYPTRPYWEEEGNRYDILRFLLENTGLRADHVPKKYEERQSTLLHCLLQERIGNSPFPLPDSLVDLEEKLLRLFIEHGLDIHSIPLDDVLDVRLVCTLSVRVLARVGRDIVTCFEEEPWTLLHTLSTREDGLEGLEALIRQGARVDRRVTSTTGSEIPGYSEDGFPEMPGHNEDGCTALMLATFRLLRHLRSKPRCFVALDVVNSSSTSCSPCEELEYDDQQPRYFTYDDPCAELRRAVEDGSNVLFEHILFFLRNGADPLLANCDGLTPLTAALCTGQSIMIRDMIELDIRREERYGSLSCSMIQQKWENEDQFWETLLPAGALTRTQLEPVLEGLPPVNEEEIDYLEPKWYSYGERIEGSVPLQYKIE
ncbi:hypothetical protein BJ508DRAFT_92306 [Ascobolus immersus RN42]|uniref:Uncharacterized protein n=1 Tax=Ascobolus immersus RN42 TaxID=1160509 RepID=A0A3N4I7T2_ASCIM|nr:hypothetical protein BJ508DRAFT_92306 [Ascobolus immersus RN42]